ncbi:hypothetical protein SDC9_177673 [bioreactor metagenome]|uniref:Uncharacterized protein n=1 Tax=bioreactor metagenome TaxID=1076179 RepID=A0A645GV40_9ZZZZ
MLEHYFSLFFIRDILCSDFCDNLKRQYIHDGFCFANKGVILPDTRIPNNVQAIFCPSDCDIDYITVYKSLNRI